MSFHILQIGTHNSFKLTIHTKHTYTRKTDAVILPNISSGECAPFYMEIPVRTMNKTTPIGLGDISTHQQQEHWVSSEKWSAKQVQLASVQRCISFLTINHDWEFLFAGGHSPLLPEILELCACKANAQCCLSCSCVTRVGAAKDWECIVDLPWSLNL